MYKNYGLTYISINFQGCYDTMDAGWKDKGGFVFVMAREDDVLNVAGHRLSSAALEEALLSHEDVVDAAVVAVKDDLKGELPLGLFVAREGSE
jgi:propionyl-CoA synthetase